MKNQLSNSSRLYEYRLVILIFFAWGFLFLDRSALSYIIPAMVGDLELTTGQVGQINMWQTIGFAISGPIIGMISDKTGKRKPLLIAAILATAVFSALSGLANSYHSLLIIRFLVGVCEGPIYPLAMLMIASASSPGRFGRNAGIVNAGVAVIAVALGPILVTQTISMLNWHWAFVIISIPSLILGLLVYLFTNEISPDKTHQTEQKQKTSFTDIFKYRNIVLCMLIAIFGMGGIWIFYSYVPLFLTSVGQMSIERMGMIMSAMGLLGILTTIGIPMFSDYFGRKKTLIIFALLGVLAPLGLYFFPVSTFGIILLMLFGGMLGTLTPIFFNVIPQETVPPHLTATSVAIIIGVGEIFGSFIVGGSGALADVHGFSFVMIVSAIATFLVAIISFGLIETNQRVKKSSISTVTVEKIAETK